MRRGGCGVWGEDTHVITTLQNGPGVLASGRILVFTTHTDSSSQYEKRWVCIMCVDVRCEGSYEKRCVVCVWV